MGGKKGEVYNWCTLADGSWDYCSPDKYTIHKKKCTGSCTTKGDTSYNWCSTASGWDYCSPVGSKGNIREATTSAWETILMLCILIPCLLIICITRCKVCR